MPKSAVVKLGGHSIFEGLEMDTKYIRELKEVLAETSRLYDWVAIVVGGGEIARKYISWGRELGLNESTLDVIGLRVAAVNASFLWAYFHGVAPPRIPTSIYEALEMLPIWRTIFVGGMQPAQSTTTVAALLAEALRADKLVIATDVDGVYNEDPKRNPAARKFDEVTVSELEQLFGKELIAGGYRLMDRLTLSIIKRSKVKVRVIAGKPAFNILRALRGDPVGTLIIPE